MRFHLSSVKGYRGFPPLLPFRLRRRRGMRMGRYIYHPSFIDPPVDESELDEDGLTEQDRADSAQC